VASAAEGGATPGKRRRTGKRGAKHVQAH
jgi:hypothetical protein